MPLAIPPDLRLTGALPSPGDGSPATANTPSSSSPRGRALAAGRAFEAGELIARFGRKAGLGTRGTALVLADSASLAVTCAYCLRPGGHAVRACTGCRTSAYCSPACQRSDWVRVAHKAGECKAFQRVRAERGGGDGGGGATTPAPLLPTAVRALMQVLLRDDLRATIDDLDGHLEIFRSQAKSTEWRDMELQALAALHYLGRPATPESVAMAMEIICKVFILSSPIVGIADGGWKI